MRALAEARAHHAADRLAEAEAAYLAALAAAPGSTAALRGLGVVAVRTGRAEAAVARFTAALDGAGEAERPALHEALAAVHRRLGEPAPALAHYREAARLQPGSATAAMNLGAALGDAHAYAEAADAFAHAARLEPRLLDAWRAQAVALNRLGRHAEAAEIARKGLEHAPEDAQLARSLAVALKEQGRLAEAAAILGRRLHHQPDDLDARYTLGAVLKDQGRTAEAVAAYRELLRRAPSHAAARVALCMAHLPPLCRDEAERQASRAAYAAELRALADWAQAAAPDALADGVGASQPFYLAYQGEDDVELQRLYGALVCRAMAARFPPAPLATHAPGERIRVGVVSGFLRDHANWRLPIRGWVETLDRARFEVTGYHTGAQVDATTAEVAALFDRFVQGPLPTEAWRARILADRPHVLIHPEVGMDPAALRLAALRLAPVQCVSWGHPVTSGLPTMDVFLSSAAMEPPGAEAAYTERLVRLPGLSTPARLPPPAAPAPRDRLGLRDGACVFWCGQSPYKYLPRHDEVFARIAQAAGDCQFVFAAFPGSDELTRRFQARLARAFAAYGVDAARVCVTLPRLAPADFACAMAASDVVLDSLGWSGCNSLIEALACGLPAITVEGGALRARHGAAILRAAGLDRFVCATVDDYVALAVRLARDPAARRRDAGIAHRLAAALADAAPTRALEDVLTQAVRDRAPAA